MRCCHSAEYGELFSAREAQRNARRYARRGLRGSARELADAVAAAGVADATILEVGGGVGDVHAHLLRAGAARATNVELSPSWEDSAKRMLADLGLAGRVRRHVGDFLDLVGDLPDADVVILHRVICCYPDWRGMLGAALSRADRVVALTVPVDRWTTRQAVRAVNRLLSWRGRSFRAFVHPPSLLIATVEAAGFTVCADDQTMVWRTIVAHRPSARGASGASTESPGDVLGGHRGA